VNARRRRSVVALGLLAAACDPSALGRSAATPRGDETRAASGAQHAMQVVPLDDVANTTTRAVLATPPGMDGAGGVHGLADGASTDAKAAPPTESAARTARQWLPREDDLVAPKQALQLPNEQALDGFFAALAALDDGAERKVRVVHLGDSTNGLDGFPHAIRKRFQSRFGDGGPGFVLPQRPTSNYKPVRVNYAGSGAWKNCYIAYGCKKDGRYGLGGFTFSTEGAVTAKILPKDVGETPAQLAHVELWYAGIPWGGKINLRVGDAVETLDARAEAVEDRFHTVDVSPGDHPVTVSTTGSGPTRMYGLVLEYSGGGVVWDGMSMIGCFTRRLLNWDESHIAEQVKRRDPDLVVFTYGGNDLRRVVAAGLTKETFSDELRNALRKVRAGKPDVACVVTSVVDHGRSGSVTVKPEHMEVIVGTQREVALAEGCAFFDTWAAMGGAGSIYEWLAAKPSLAEPDLKHLNHRGREVMGENVYRALMAEYVKYRGRAG
jgi:lysophospholipase L1-like esterase